MAHLSSAVEYALHCLLWIVPSLDERPSTRDLAELQGVSPSFLAKIFQKLEKAGIVEAAEGFRGGYHLARSPEHITILDVVDAIEGATPLFNCQEIRGRCALFDGTPPAWATQGICGIHAAMLRAEKAMREELQRTSLATLAQGAGKKAPAVFAVEVRQWMSERFHQRKSRPAERFKRRPLRSKAKS
jgi:Rrf2 family protein